MTEKQERIFREGSVWRAIASMALPAMVTMVVMILYNIADLFFVGQLGDYNQVAAVSLAGPVFSLLMAIGSMLGGGGCALIANQLGAGNREGVRLSSSLCCWGSVLFGAVFCAVLVTARTPILGLLGANEDTWQYAEQYLLGLSIGAPVMIFTTTFGNLVRAEGAVKEGMLSSLLGTVTNVILDPIFILLLNLGVGGAAVATVLGNVVSALYLLFILRAKPTNLSLSLRLAASKPLAIGQVLALGFPNGISTTLSSFASALANQLLMQYGTVAVAAMAAAGKSTMVIGMIQMGLCMGVQPLLAYSYGARNLPRLGELLRKLTLLTVVLGSALTLLCLAASETLVALFLKEEAALELGVEMIRLLVLSGPFIGIYYVGTNFLQASGNAGLASLLSLLRQGILLVPFLFLMNALFGMTGNICAHLAADLTASVVAAALALRQYRHLKQTLAEGAETAQAA